MKNKFYTKNDYVKCCVEAFDNGKYTKEDFEKELAHLDKDPCLNIDPHFVALDINWLKTNFKHDKQTKRAISLLKSTLGVNNYKTSPALFIYGLVRTYLLFTIHNWEEVKSKQSK